MYTLKVATVLLTLSGAVSAAFDPGCAGRCQNSTRDTFKTLKCASADDAACICRSPDFMNGVVDCMNKSHCTFDSAELTGFLKGYCGANPLPNAAPSSKPPAPATSAPASAPASSAPAPASTSAAPASASSSSVEPSQTAQTTLQTSSSTVSQQASATSDAAAETSSAAAAPDTAPSGISHAASVGIGVGIAAAVVGAAIVGFCVYKNRKKTQKPRQSMEISKPLPGSGRTYPDNHNDRDSLDKYDIEMSSNRYEDMAQGQQPRTMV